MDKFKEINQLNIDDYIRELKKKGRKTVKWSTNEWKLLAHFVWSATCDVFTGKRGYKIKNGDLVCGLRHYKK